MSLTRRIAAIAAVLTLSVGNLAVCAGWEATPAERMACCTDDARCPMHPASERSDATRVVSQVEADSCCAGASDRTQAPVAGFAFVLLHATSTLPSAPLAVAPPVFALEHWRTVVPLPETPVPKHLLFSVLIV